MCGISGIYTPHLSEPQHKLIKDIIASQHNRGPDHQAIVKLPAPHAELLLGHNRLKIIDLSDQANQPMWDSSGRYCIIYNGEIYNYIELRQTLLQHGLHFNTQSDTEVVLNAFAHWGIAALSHFRGPFAFALYDKNNGNLWLCRDRFAVRPLYYIQVNNTLYFASSTRVLAKTLQLKPNLLYVAKGLNYLVYEDESEHSAYLNLQTVPAGCYLQANFNHTQRLSLTLQRYYHLQDNVQHLIANLPVQNTKQLCNQVYEKLTEAVQIRMRSDVPLAISLSGGLDSSSVAALVSDSHENTLGFSVGHPQQHSTEGPVIAQCAEFLNIPIEYVWPTATEMLGGLYETLNNQDAPFASLSVVAQHLLYKKVRACGVKVLLGGQGGDEAFMGYKKFLLFHLRQQIRRKNYFASLKHCLQLIPMLWAELPAIPAYWAHRHRYKKHQSHRLPNLRLPQAQLNLSSDRQHLWQRQASDILQFSLPTLLRYEDRNGMGNSVESRLPYLDHQLIELGLALPESIKLRAGFGKWVIRAIMQDKIPDAIRLARYKRGFDIPLTDLLHAGLGHSIRHHLTEQPALLNEFIRKPNTVNTLFSDQALQKRRGAMAEAISLLWLKETWQ